MYITLLNKPASWSSSSALNSGSDTIRTTAAAPQTTENVNITNSETKDKKTESTDCNAVTKLGKVESQKCHRRTYVDSEYQPFT